MPKHRRRSGRGRKSSRAFSRILLAVDGSESSRRAARTAVRLAKENGAELIVASVTPPQYVIPPISTSIGGGIGPGTVATPVIPDAEYVRVATNRSKRYIDDAVAHMKASKLKLRKRVLRDSWSVPRSITDYAADHRVDLVVVGGSSVRGLKRFVLGSVSNGVVNNASTSVLVVR